MTTTNLVLYSKMFINHIYWFCQENISCQIAIIKKKIGKPVLTNSRLPYIKQDSIARKLKAKFTILARIKQLHYITLYSKQVVLFFSTYPKAMSFFCNTPTHLPDEPFFVRFGETEVRGRSMKFGLFYTPSSLRVVG